MIVKAEEIEKFIEKYNYSLCIWSDKTDFLENKNLQKSDKLLEIHCFDKSGEFYAFRSDIAKNFTAREITDDNMYDGFFDEEHFLDIDTTKKLSGGKVQATGGGVYYLPVTNAEKIKVRFYFRFDENGIARKCDWRLVDFVKKEGNNNG